ncbi:MAG: glycosyl transferase [Bacteroidetes bacterium]|nr:glycosyl transferase [Bacteroidota bacterium]
MKILYAIQGTGNGHMARAREILPMLQQDHEVDILISGIQADIDLPFPVKYRLNGLSFIFGKKGGIDILETYKKSNLKKLYREIRELPVTDYDMVLNDFEPVSAWACKTKNVVCVAVSHQAAVLHKNAPQPKKPDLLGKAVLKKYAPALAKYGFHFEAYDDHIFTPVIRKEVRELTVENRGHYTVYLPAYDDKRILAVLTQCPGVRWEVFSKHNKEIIKEANVSIRPISNDLFLASMAAAEGVLCGAGFETPAEALFLGKKLMVIPMKTQFEQQCNAAALKKLGVPVIKSLKEKHLGKIHTWLQSAQHIEVNYPDQTAAIFKQIIVTHDPAKTKKQLGGVKKLPKPGKFREESLKEILKQLEA